MFICVNPWLIFEPDQSLQFPIPPGTGHAHGLGIGKEFGIAAKDVEDGFQPRLNQPVIRRIKPAVQAFARGINDGVQIEMQPVVHVGKHRADFVFFERVALDNEEPRAVAVRI